MLLWQRGEPSAVTYRRMQSLATQMLFDEPHMEDDTTATARDLVNHWVPRSRQEG
jgi:hypothetical protein